MPIFEEPTDRIVQNRTFKNYTFLYYITKVTLTKGKLIKMIKMFLMKSYEVRFHIQNFTVACGNRPDGRFQEFLIL